MKYELEAALLSITISCAGGKGIPTRTDRQPFADVFAELGIDPSFCLENARMQFPTSIAICPSNTRYRYLGTQTI